MSSFQKLRRYYTGCALVFVNSLVVLVLLNAAASLAFWIRGSDYVSPIVRSFGIEHVAKAYPGWDREELVEFLRVDNTVSIYEPFTQFRPRVVRGPYINVSSHGFRHSDEQGAWPPPSDSPCVFLFGGSTTYGAGLPDEQTIGSYLQQYLRDHDYRVNVYNFGRPNYFSTQERILFERLVSDGAEPSVAVFVDGLNDFSNWKGEPRWTSELSSLVDEVFQQTDARYAAGRLFRKLSLGRAADAFSRRMAGQRGSQQEEGEPAWDDAGVSDTIVQRMLTNQRITDAVASSYGIDTAYVIQPVPTYKYDIDAHLFAGGNFDYFRGFRRARFGYAGFDRMASSGQLPENVLWLGALQAGRTENLYVDSVHYSAAFSREIAENIGVFLLSRELRACGEGE